MTSRAPHHMDSLKNDAASALASLSTPTSDDEPPSELPSAPTKWKDPKSEVNDETCSVKLPHAFSKTTDGNVSDSDLSSTGSLSSAGPTPKAVHAPPVNKMMVDHTYTDYSVLNEDYLALYCGYPDVNSNDVSDGDGGVNKDEKRIQAKKMKNLRKIFRNKGQTRKNSGGVVQPFPAKLMEVLDRGDMDESICWMPHGRAFAVLQPPVFVKEVLPRFFKQSKVTSFTRQLNLWGFKRITKGTDSGAYYHELFLRGRPRLCMMMRRQKIKGTGIKLTPNPDTEPNFYVISKDSPLPPPAKDTKLPLPPLQQQSERSLHSGSRGECTQISKPSGRNPHSLIGTDSPSATAANRLTAQHGSNNLHFRMLSDVGQHQQHRMQTHYPLQSHQARQIRRGYESNVLLNHLPMQDQGVSRRHNNVIKTVPDTYNRSLTSSDLSPIHRSLPSYFSDQHRVLEDERRIAAEQHVRSQRENAYLNAIVKERMALEKEEQRYRAQATMSTQAQELLNRAPEGQESRSDSVEALKHRLMVAARSLGDDHQPVSRANAFASDPLNALMHGGAGAVDSEGGGGGKFMRFAPTASPHHYQTQHQPMQSQQQRVNLPALMSVLEQTQKVAAAAHEQSAMLQRFAQNLREDSSVGDARGGRDSYGNNPNFPFY